MTSTLPYPAWFLSHAGFAARAGDQAARDPAGLANVRAMTRRRLLLAPTPAMFVIPSGAAAAISSALAYVGATAAEPSAVSASETAELGSPAGRGTRSVRFDSC